MLSLPHGFLMTTAFCDGIFRLIVNALSLYTVKGGSTIILVAFTTSTTTTSLFSAAGESNEVEITSVSPTYINSDSAKGDIKSTLDRFPPSPIGDTVYVKAPPIAWSHSSSKIISGTKLWLFLVHHLCYKLRRQTS